MLSPFYHPKYIEAGVDEVGRGCLAGPVVAAAVILPKQFELKVNDSKKLSAKDRYCLEIQIKQIALAWSIAEVNEETIDKINILQASFLAMHTCVEQLKMKPEHLLIDGNRFKPYPFIPHTCVVKGDGIYASIAAASILAKCYRDRLMEQLAQQYPVYDWEHNVGYPTPKHKKALHLHGLSPYHRKSFKF